MTALRSRGRGTRDGTAPRVCVINYGMGNLVSVVNALTFLGYEPQIIDAPHALSNGDAFVLPGVGAFGEAMRNLNESGLGDALGEQVLGEGKPFLGICLGMQLIAQSSSELGEHEGLGWIEGRVVTLPETPSSRVPNVGWNEVRVRESGDALFDGISGNGCFFFDHSFHLECDDKYVSATCEGGFAFIAAVRHENLHATQFHPERSQRSGLRLLRNFLERCEVWCGNEAGVNAMTGTN